MPPSGPRRKRAELDRREAKPKRLNAMSSRLDKAGPAMESATRSGETCLNDPLERCHQRFRLSAVRSPGRYRT